MTNYPGRKAPKSHLFRPALPDAKRSRRWDRKGLKAGLIAASLLSVSILLGSRGLRDFDPALTAYAMASVFAVFACGYRYAVWLQRPPTRIYWERGWGLIFRRGQVTRNLVHLARSLFDSFVAQRFIGRRSRLRWWMHFCLSWGCMLAFALTFPLVFGWIHFETRADSPEVYRLFNFGLPVFEFPLHSLWSLFFFNALNFSAVMVLVGVALSLKRRLAGRDARALQNFGNDILPLFMLFAIAVTGLMLTVSARCLEGYGYPFLALLHAVTVITVLLYLPFGKFFHILQRPAQLSVVFYKQAGREGRQSCCARCGEAFASGMHVDDLKLVLSELGFDYTTESGGHYQDVCPACRRKLLALSQGKLLGR